jgi:hypothetical protein
VDCSGGELGCSGGGSPEESGGRGEETSAGEITPILLPAWQRERNMLPPCPPGPGLRPRKGWCHGAEEAARGSRVAAQPHVIQE